MKVAALIAWLLTATGGFLLLARWVSEGGIRSTGTNSPSRFPPAVIFGHLGLAAAGLVVWIVYLVAGSTTLAWIAFGLLVPVALLGFVMVARWAATRRSLTGTATTSTDARPPEQHFPVVIVVGHGALAVTTVVLVLLAALRGGSG